MTFAFAALSSAVSEGAGQAQIIITRSGNTLPPATVDYATNDGSANDRGDYATAIGNLNFAAGETARPFNVLITDDAYAEGSENFQITLSNPSAGALINGSANALVTIIDNDLTTSATNPNDFTDFFVRQHYADFLNRAPDDAGFSFWVNNINSCGANASCVEPLPNL